MSEIHHETVYFSGRVQGVGFRYTTLQIAKEFDVAGWAKNLPDGRVQLEVEGDAKAVKEFIQAVQERLHGYIRDVDRHGGPRVPQYRGFTIR